MDPASGVDHGDVRTFTLWGEIAYQLGDTTLADQTIAFLMSLMKFVAESKRAVLVYTLTESIDAFGKEADELRQEMAEARSVSARQEHVLTPTRDENEISAIVAHRLFAKVDGSAAEETATEFSESYPGDDPALVGKAMQHLVLQFGDGDQFNGDFTGSWERYKRIKSATDNLW